MPLCGIVKPPYPFCASKKEPVLPQRLPYRITLLLLGLNPYALISP